MRLLITGGTGFVGRHLLDQIAAGVGPCGLSDVVISSRTHAEVGHQIEQVRWDVCDADLPDVEFDAIIHAATPASAELNARAPRLMFDQIVVGARNVIELCVRQKQPPRLLFTSSGAVYGEMPESLSAWPEDSRMAASPSYPNNAYASGKRAAEAMFALAGHEGVCRPTIARLFAFSGRHLPLDHHFAIGNFVRDALAGGPIRVRGTGETVRSYLDGDDMADWLLESLMATTTENRTLHVGSDHAVTIEFLAKLVAQVASEFVGSVVRVQLGKASSELDGRHRYLPSLEETAKLIRCSIKKPLEVSLREMLVAGHTGSARSSG